MSEFTSAESSVSPVKKSWADSESDSDNDDLKVSNRNVEEEREKIVQSINGEDNDVKEDEEGEDEENFEDDSSQQSEDDSVEEDNGSYKLNLIPTNQTACQKKGKLSQNLSKKEKLEQRLKELDDLDVILSQFKVTNDEVVEGNSVEAVGEAGSDNMLDEKTKKKRKKKTSNAPTTNTAEVAGAANEVPSVPVDVSKILKSRTTKAKKSSMSEAQKLAIAEAAKKDSSKKKKKDKSKFSEGSY